MPEPEDGWGSCCEGSSSLDEGKWSSAAPDVSTRAGEWSTAAGGVAGPVSIELGASSASEIDIRSDCESGMLLASVEVRNEKKSSMKSCLVIAELPKFDSSSSALAVVYSI